VPRVSFFELPVSASHNHLLRVLPVVGCRSKTPTDGPATEPQEEGDGGSSEKEEGGGDTHFEGVIDEGGLMKNYPGGTKWRPMGMNVG
jgi:hypothetical protein